MDSPEIYKTLGLKRTENKDAKSDLDNKEKEDEQSYFSKMFNEDYVEEEEKKQKDKIQKILDEMHKIAFCKEDEKR